MRLFARSEPMAVVDETEAAYRSACGEALPILAQHIDTSHQQMETAITSLSQKFSAIVGRLDDALAVSSDLTSGQGIATTLAAGKQQLQDVVEELRTINASRTALTDEIRKLSACTQELRGMAEEVSQIAFKTNMLSLNAAIEAAHAGEAGKGFAVVAQEVRGLSQASRETGRRINERIESISSTLEGLTQRSESALELESAAVTSCEGRIGDVLAQFGISSQSLSETTDRLKTESSTIKGELEDAIMHLQFQDRVSQILSHAAQSIRSLGTQAQLSERFGHEQVAELLAGFAASYTTEEQRRAHDPSRAETAAPAAVTFF